MEAKLAIRMAPSGLYSTLYLSPHLPALMLSSFWHPRARHDGLFPADASYRIAAKWRARATSEAVHASELSHSLPGPVPGFYKVRQQTRTAEAAPFGNLPSTQSTPVKDSNPPARENDDIGSNRNSSILDKSRESATAPGKRRPHHSPEPSPRQLPPAGHHHEQPHLTRTCCRPPEPSPKPHQPHQRQQKKKKLKRDRPQDTRLGSPPSHPQHSRAERLPPQSQSQPPQLPPEPQRLSKNPPFQRSSPQSSVGQRPQFVNNNDWKCRTPKQITAALYGSTSLQQLLAQLEVCGPLNAVQLCAAFIAAERIAAREGGGTEAGRSPCPPQYGIAPWKNTGLLAPPCRPLTHFESTALITVLAAHSEVLADADPPELAATLWAAARLRLRLSPAELGPAMEAVWMWDPADPTVNRQEDRLQQRLPTAGVSVGAPRDVIGPWEVCLLLYAVSVLWPEYVRQNAGGFLEALDSYESVGSYGSGGGLDGPRSRRRRGGGLSCEQVAGVVVSLSRADAPLDEVEEEFVLQAVSSRLAAFSLPQLTALLSAGQKWSPLRRALHGSLLAAVLSRLDEHHDRFMAARKERQRQGALKSKAPSLEASGSDSEATRPTEASERHRQSTGSGDGGDNVEDDSAAAAVARALVAVLRSGLDPTTGQPLPSRVVSSLMRQVRLRAAAFNARDVCEALRAMAALHKAPSFQVARVIRWKEGVRGLLRRWLELLRLEAAVETEAQKVAVAAATAVGEVAAEVGQTACKGPTCADGDRGGDCISGGGPAVDRAVAARTFATTLHAVAQLGIRLQAAEASAASTAAMVLAPYMNHLADCVMVLSALPEVIGGEDAAVAAVAAAEQQREAAATGVIDKVKVEAVMRGQRHSEVQTSGSQNLTE
ncbi:hypothetical protein Vretifemale_12873, partial [Volvox reticuliferus]